MAEIDKTRDLTDIDIDLLMEDWFIRDKDTFVKVRTHSRVDWESTLKEGEAYSSYFLESPTKLDLLKRAYPLAKDIIKVMGIPTKVNVQIHKGTDSFTDGKSVLVSTKMFDDLELSVGEQLDTFLGTTVHEGCHLVYTDFKADKKFSSVTAPIMTITNIIEDERIEQLLGEDKPGLARFLEKSKYYWFDSFYLEYLADRELNDYERLFQIFLHVMRYPKYLKEDDVVFFGHHLFTIKDIVKELPESTTESFEQAFKVWDVIKEFYKEKAEEEKRKKSEESSGESSEDSSSSESPSEGTDKEGKTSTGGEDTEITLTEEELSEVLAKLDKDSEGLTKVLKSLSEGLKKSLASSDVSTELPTKLTGEIVEGLVDVGVSDSSLFRKVPSSDKASYGYSLDRVRRYIPAIAKVIKGHCREYKLIHRSMRSGVLDSSKLAEAFQGVPTVYLREGEVKTDRVSVCVLIDESGSMSGPRIQAAKDTAILLNEAVGNIPQVDLFIYGHSGDISYTGATELTVYREKTFNSKYGLGSVSAKRENRDGVAIYETALRVRRQTSEHVLMFILSDGAPAASDYYGAKAMDHVKQNVKRVERMNFSVVQVCINHSYDPAKMFDHFVVLDNMSTLAPSLAKVIKKATLKAAKVHTT